MSKELKRDSLLLIGDITHLNLALLKELNALRGCFCGKVVSEVSLEESAPVYIAGEFDGKNRNEHLFIQEFALKEHKNTVPLGQVPLNIHQVGVFFPQMFPSELFQQVVDAHKFQKLKESNKEDQAYRTGLYISPVETKGDETHFQLLRCSTNFDGPTENFREVDQKIIQSLNDAGQRFFTSHAPFNHGLLQIYHNLQVKQKQVKAIISEHSDKTKDFPDKDKAGNEMGEIAFVSLYKDMKSFTHSKENRWDYVYKDTSVLTSLRFRLKKDLSDDAPKGLPSTFEVLLYPGSVLLIPRSTNRWYRHRTVPSVLPIEKIPLRMGYTVRPSGRAGKHVEGQTYILEKAEWIPLKKDDEGHMKKLYFLENTTDQMLTYPSFDVTLNEGDLIKPLS